MSLVHFTGFNGRDATTDRMIEQAGTPTYDTSVPGDSYATRSLQLANGETVRFQWHQGDTQVVPASGIWLHFRLYLGQNDTNNDQVRIGVARDNTEVISFSIEDTTALPTIRLAGSVVATAASGAVVPTTWRDNRYLLEIEGYSTNDVVRIYPDGDSSATPLVEYTITAGAASTLAGIGLPNETKIEMASNPSYFNITDVAVMDPNDATGVVDPAIFTGFTVRSGVVTSDSTPADWTGIATDIDELPFSGDDYLFSGGIDLESRFGRNNLGGITENVYSVRTVAGVSRFATSGGTEIGFEFDDGTTSEKTATVTTTVGDVVSVYHHTAPDGSDWTPSLLDNSQFSIFSRT